MTEFRFPDDKELESISCYSPLSPLKCAKKPFGDVTAEEYFEFANAARLRGDKAGLVDALSNAKRCFHYQVDRLLYRYGLRKATADMSFPKKVYLLSELKIIPGTLLRSFNKERNAMEHEYTSPTKDTVDGSMDLCELLFLAAHRFLKSTPVCMRVKFRDDPRDLITLLDPTQSKIELFEIIGTKCEKIHDRDVYTGRLFLDFSAWRPLKGIKINRLENEDIELSLPNKETWLLILKLYSDVAREDEFDKLPEVSMADIMNRLRANIQRNWLDTQHDITISTKEQSPSQLIE